LVDRQAAFSLYTQGMDMRFLVTMNMPSYTNNLVHQLNIEHAESKSLEDFIDALTKNDFVIVEEFYRDQQTGTENSRGKMAISHRFVGKIRAMTGESYHLTQNRERYRYDNNRKQSV
jgi:hypothetical protein